MKTSDISLVIPVYNEGDNVAALFESIARNIGYASEILICYDFDEDNTLPEVHKLASQFPKLRLIKNHYKRGVLGAIRSGFDSATMSAVIVMMADLSDDLTRIPAMVERFEGGAHVVTPSRYMQGGKQVGGPLFKKILSRLAGVSLHYLVGLPTHDVTNSFKLYSRTYLKSVEIESDGGFELAMELTVKAYLRGLKISELPTTWNDRTAGESRFRIWKWLPKYLRWYWFALLGSCLGLSRPKLRARGQLGVCSRSFGD